MSRTDMIDDLTDKATHAVLALLREKVQIELNSANVDRLNDLLYDFLQLAVPNSAQVEN